MNTRYTLHYHKLKHTYTKTKVIQWTKQNTMTPQRVPQQTRHNFQKINQWKMKIKCLGKKSKSTTATAAAAAAKNKHTFL